MSIDLLEYVGDGGCSAKLDPKVLADLVGKLPLLSDERALVDASSFDDAGVYKLDDERALIFTTDFFPPVCRDPYIFGRIAAANALSDIYAMGGIPLMALNLVMYPAKGLPLEGLGEILRGGSDTLQQAGCLLMGGHTIADDTPKYGLAAIGLADLDKLTTNSGAREGDLLILTKPLGVGVAIAAERLEMISAEAYQKALQGMIQLNKEAALVMQRHQVCAATDVTGFGLIGHARNIALESEVTLQFYHEALPKLPEVLQLLEEGCIPGACFRNLRFVGEGFSSSAPLSYQYLAADPETSGGILMSVPKEKARVILNDLYSLGLEECAVVGEVLPRGSSLVILD